MSLEQKLADYMRPLIELNDVARTNREIGFRHGYESRDEYSDIDVMVGCELLRLNASAEDICAALLLDFTGHFNLLSYQPAVRQAYVELALVRYGEEAKQRNKSK